jgi:hypothetical protein
MKVIVTFKPEKNASYDAIIERLCTFEVDDCTRKDYKSSDCTCFALSMRIFVPVRDLM